jgi:hypothetical protein
VPIRNTTPICRLGCGIHKVIFLCGEIKDLVSDSDKHCAYLEDSDDMDLNNEFQGLNKDEVEDLKRECVYMVVFVLFSLADTLPSWEHSYTAVQELNHLIPNFQKKIDEGSPEELNEFHADVSIYIGAFFY